MDATSNGNVKCSWRVIKKCNSVVEELCFKIKSQLGKASFYVNHYSTQVTKIVTTKCPYKMSLQKCHHKLSQRIVTTNQQQNKQHFWYTLCCDDKSKYWSGWHKRKSFPFGVRSVGLYTCQSLVAVGGTTLWILWAMGLACLTWGLVGSNLQDIDENTRLSRKGGGM